MTFANAHTHGRCRRNSLGSCQHLALQQEAPVAQVALDIRDLMGFG